jgi:uncharacterized membrane protein YeaQ/YmgE (transglycosylase-associated protein family)
MSKKLAVKTAIVSAATGVTALVTNAYVALAVAAAPTCDPSLGITGGAECAKGGGAASSLPTLIGVISNVIFGLVGSIAVLYLILGGISYITSQGDQKKIEGAKNTILYAIIGIVVVIASYALASFVIGQFANK